MDPIRFPVKAKYAFIEGGKKLTSFHIRVCGKRERDAADKLMEVLPKDADEKTKNKWAEDRINLAIKLSIAKVNDADVEAPYHGLDKWSDQATALVMTAYREVNSFSDKDADAFLAGAGQSPESAPESKG